MEIIIILVIIILVSGSIRKRKRETRQHLEMIAALTGKTPVGFDPDPDGPRDWVKAVTGKRERTSKPGYADDGTPLCLCGHSCHVHTSKDGCKVADCGCKTYLVPHGIMKVVK